MEKNNFANRPLAEQSTSLRLFQDNYDEITEICKVTKNRHFEEIRLLIDEALRARRMEKLGEGVGIDNLIKNYEQLVDLNTREKEELSRNMREFFGLLLETLSAAIVARRMTWNYIARTVLKQSGYSDEQVVERYEAEMQAGAGERDDLADKLEQEIEKMMSGGDQQSASPQATPPATPATPD